MGIGCSSSSVQEFNTDSRPSSTTVTRIHDNTADQRRRATTQPTPASGERGKISVKEEGVERISAELGSVRQDLPFGDFGGDYSLGVTKNTARLQKALAKLATGELWFDEEFPADDEALYYSGRSVPEDLRWLRPQKIADQPMFLSGGATKDDIQQGNLGDCWFLSSCAAIAREPHLMKRVMPEDEPLSGESYHGIAHFRFWRFGSWVDVYVDDQLPTQAGQLVFARSNDKREFWVALIEKAYAKLHGSYEAIEGGHAKDALVDLTGGLAEVYEVNEDSVEHLYRHLQRAAYTGAFIACSKKGDWREATQADQFGLVAGHAYTVTSVRKVVGHELLRVRNPWGNDTEWTGDWSDGNDMWEQVSEEEKRELDLIDKGDGEFWMDFNDFCKHFQEVTICTLSPDLNNDSKADVNGKVRAVHGSWSRDVSAGGCRNNLEMFSTNPQYLLTLTEADRFDPRYDDEKQRGKCSLVIGMMQEHRRSQRHLGSKTLQIGFVIYKTNDPSKRLPQQHFMYNYDSGTSGTYINYREVTARFELDPGHYVIIPTTFKPGFPASFMIRVFAEKDFDLRELSHVIKQESGKKKHEKEGK